MKKPLPSLDILNDLLEFDFEKGEMRWRRKETNRVKVGKIAGYTAKNGYKSIRIRGELFLCHRIFWKAFTGKDPVQGIDHIDGNPSNNCISNLRESTQQQNILNRVVDKSSASGLKGISFHKAMRKWHARVCLNGKIKNLGYYEDPMEAHKAYIRGSKELHGEFSVFNRPSSSE